MVRGRTWTALWGLILLRIASSRRIAPKVFVLAGDEACVGLARESDLASSITLHPTVHNLLAPSQSTWALPDNIFVTNYHHDHTMRAPLAFDFGQSPGLFGPEVGLGARLSKAHREPVVIVKTCLPQRSLSEDFRPPSAGFTTGNDFFNLVDTIQHTMANLHELIGVAEEGPDGQPLEIDPSLAGFIWWQGHNDMESQHFLAEYSANLNHLIHDVRTRLGAAPFVIAGLTSAKAAIEKTQILSFIQQRVAAQHASVAFLPTCSFGLEREGLDGAIVHDATAMISIGEAFANVLLDLNEEGANAANTGRFTSQDLHALLQSRAFTWIALVAFATLICYFQSTFVQKNHMIHIVENDVEMQCAQRRLVALPKISIKRVV